MDEGRGLLDAGASTAFAVADRQVAHVYINDPNLAVAARVPAVVATFPGVDRVLDGADKEAEHIDHSRAGQLVAVAALTSGFTYYYWPEGADEVAPDFVRSVDIHHKPGYDPVELFVDPNLVFAKGRIASRLAQESLGM